MRRLDYYTIHYRSREDLLPGKVQQLRSKLSHKAKNEPKFRFYALYDRVYRWDVLVAAWKHVSKPGKACGVDGVRAEDVLASEEGERGFLESIQHDLKTKTYRPSPIKRVYIPKGDGKLRPLGIPVLRDRVVQMAVQLILEPIFEADFMDCSHGFRPGRKAHDALEAIRGNLKEGKMQVLDADLKGYFDSIPHEKLMACVRMRVTDSGVLGLIRGWLSAPIIDGDDKPQPPKRSDKGTPQGGVISPLLANIYLHWFDVVFHRKGGPAGKLGARLVRYADDFVILTRYQSAWLDEWLHQHLTNWMDLELNQEKTKRVSLSHGEALDFLGYTFRYDHDLKGRDKKYLNVFPSKKSLKRARDRVRELTGPRMCYKPTPYMVKDLNSYLRGWSAYFSYGYPRKAFRDLNYHCWNRIVVHLNRRSQRKYHRPKGMTDYQYIYKLGLLRL